MVMTGGANGIVLPRRLLEDNWLEAGREEEEVCRFLFAAILLDVPDSQWLVMADSISTVAIREIS
jgi:hypothetical protein